jgi:uncharacterized membrane protein YvbJ
MFCHYCGKQVADDVKFCPYCGKAVDGSDLSSGADAAKQNAAASSNSRNDRMEVNGRPVDVDNTKHGVRKSLLICFIVGILTAMVGFIIQICALSSVTKKGSITREEKTLLTIGLFISFAETALVFILFSQYFGGSGHWGFSWDW